VFYHDLPTFIACEGSFCALTLSSIKKPEKNLSRGCEAASAVVRRGVAGLTTWKAARGLNARTAMWRASDDHWSQVRKNREWRNGEVVATYKLLPGWVSTGSE